MYTLYFPPQSTHCVQRRVKNGTKDMRCAPQYYTLASMQEEDAATPSCLQANRLQGKSYRVCALVSGGKDSCYRLEKEQTSNTLSHNDQPSPMMLLIDDVWFGLCMRGWGGL